jgi:hypothetical protein
MISCYCHPRSYCRFPNHLSHIDACTTGLFPGVSASGCKIIKFIRPVHLQLGCSVFRERDAIHCLCNQVNFNRVKLGVSFVRRDAVARGVHDIVLYHFRENDAGKVCLYSSTKPFNCPFMSRLMFCELAFDAGECRCWRAINAYKKTYTQFRSWTFESGLDTF